MARASSAQEKAELTNRFKVRLVSASNVPYRSGDEGDAVNVQQKRGRINTRVVEFDVTPDVTETRNVEYKTMQPLHMPGSIHAYASTSSRTFSLSSVKLISRTISEATKTMQTLWTLRGWTMPNFGRNNQPRQTVQNGNARPFSNSQGTALGISTDQLGRPPEVLYLSAYSNVPPLQGGGSQLPQRKFATNISNVPVVITSLSIPYPSDVDYIPDENGNPVPRVMVIDIQCVETQSPSTLSRRFSLRDYRSGTLSGF